MANNKKVQILRAKQTVKMTQWVNYQQTESVYTLGWDTLPVVGSPSFEVSAGMMIQTGIVDGIRTSPDTTITVSNKASTVYWQGSQGGHSTGKFVVPLDIEDERVALIKEQVEGIANQIGVYGVVHNYEQSSPDLTRIGNMSYHKILPVQSLMRRCLLNDDGTVNYYLDPNDSTKKADGSAAYGDGRDGQVMVEVPAHYRKHTLDSVAKTFTTEISLAPFRGAMYVPKYYVGAYEAALDRTNNKLASVDNWTAQYRGGNNTSSWDGTYRTLIARPVTNISLTNFRTYAHNRGAGWNCYEYFIHMDLYWLFAIEYATLNSQKTFNAALDGNGYHQGGLGPGVSNIPDWNGYNGYNPMIPCGVTNPLGNNTGVVTHNVMASNGVSVYYAAPVPSYRGVENPFGHIWKWTDGYLCVGNGTNQDVYTCRRRDQYASSVNGHYIGIGQNCGDNGYPTRSITNLQGDFCPTSVSGGSSSYYWCDYYYQAHSNGTTYGLFVGSRADIGAFAGFACFRSDDAPSYSASAVGSRLCYSNANEIFTFPNN